MKRGLKKLRITRTITGTRATVIALNPSSLIATKKVVSVNGTFDGNAKLLKTLKSLYDNETEIISAVLSTDKFEELYGLDEAIFIKYAVKLDPKTRKPLGDTEPAPLGNPIPEPAPEPRKKNK